jgi:hypothetical protein
MCNSGLVEWLPMETVLAFVGLEIVHNNVRLRISVREDCNMYRGTVKVIANTEIHKAPVSVYFTGGLNHTTSG